MLESAPDASWGALYMQVSESRESKKLYEFGPFRVDAEKEILLRAGEPVPLTPKTFQVLLVLVRRSSEVVTKDDLMKAVWPDTNVEEANLSRNVFMLRKALGESPQDHQYIVTVPGRGYRFAENVRLVPDQELNIVAASHTKVQVQVGETTPWRLIAVAVIVVIAVAAGAFRFLWLRRPVPAEKDTVVLGDFANSTGDPVFDGTLRQGLSIQLEQSPFLSIISDEQIEQTLRMMDRKPDARLTPEVAREVCQRTGGTVDLEGSISRIGAQYLLTVKALNCANGDSLGSAEATARDENQVLGALGQVSASIRNELGESLSTLQRFDTPLERATTPSLAALKAFSSGISVINTRGSDAAIPFFEHAIELDPKFALPYAYLGIMENDILEPSKAVEYQSKAYELREQTSEVEKYSITATYEKDVTGNIDEAMNACELWIQSYPRAFHPHDLLAGMILPVIGQYDRAALEASNAIRLNPDFPIAYGQRMFSLIALDRIDEAKATYTQALQRKLSNPQFEIALYQIAFLQNDDSGMAREIAQTKGIPGFEHQLLNLEGDTAAYSGRLRDARELSGRAIDSARAAGQKDAPLIYLVTSGLREAWFGNADESRRRITLARKGTPSRDMLYLSALAYAYSGEIAQAQMLTDDLRKKFPEDTLVQFNYLPTLRARIALDKGNPPEAIEQLKAAAPYELGASTAAPFTWTAMYPVFVRGEAYLAARKGLEAETEFEKILDHPGIVLNQPIGALAHLGLARAYALERDKAKARAAYEDFLTLWKHADPDIPILRQAKTEYAKLK